MDLKLTAKRALVTGSSAGIGKAIARRLAEEGAGVVVTGRDAGKTEAAARDIGATSKGAIVGFAADLSTDEGAASLTERVTAELEGVDILINNHGAYFNRTWWDTPPAAWAEIYNQNVVAFVRLIQHLGPPMRAAGWGRIINISSGGASQPFATMADYTATKAAILNMSVSLAKEFAGTGVTVNTISPGIIATDTSKASFRAMAKAQGWPDDWPTIERNVMAHVLANSSGRLGRPDDVALVAAFIASPLADYVNGANYRVDGGSTVSIN